MTNSNKPPVFCEQYCPVCRGARKGNPLFKTLQGLELKLFGKKGCPWGQARYRYYGVTPDQPLSAKKDKGKDKPKDKAISKPKVKGTQGNGKSAGKNKKNRK